MKEQILIVDDELDISELLSYNLRKAGYVTLVVHTGEDALNAVRHQAPDLLLLDVMMPELNGWEVCRIIRESAKGMSIPIIMLTALSDENARIKGLSLGADDYIPKPFSIKELLLRIKKIMDRQLMIKQLQTREQEQAMSLHYLVHELKNAACVMGGFSALGLQKQDAQKYLKKVNIAAAHVDGLLAEASLLSQLEKAENTLPLEPLDIGALVREAIEVIHDAAENRGIEVLCVNNTLSWVLCNKTAVRQVLANLLSNAVKYNRECGKVWIHFDESSGWVDVSVTDEGHGMKQVELTKIFAKFYRVDGSEQVKGTGLGLYIVKLLTAAMGGKIRALSNPCVGSTFTLSLPTAPAPHLDAGKTLDKRTVQPA